MSAICKDQQQYTLVKLQHSRQVCDSYFELAFLVTNLMMRYE